VQIVLAQRPVPRYSAEKDGGRAIRNAQIVGYALMVCGIVLLVAAALHHMAAKPVRAATVTAAATWSPAAAAKFMDSRETWWQSWPHANRDHGTQCVSCHTQPPYALARPILSHALGETAQPAAETAMLADVEKRVRNWDQMLPFYDDKTYGTGKEIESRNAESVLNSIILTNYDIPKNHLSELTRTAYDHAWALQSKDGPDAGAWVWQNFEYTPWESKESQYHWAALLAVSIAEAPENYRADPKIQQNLKLLSAYLQSHYEAQPLWNKVAALWATTCFPDLLSNQQRSALLGLVYSLQAQDGGWSMASLGAWQRRDGTPEETRPDGYATGFITLVLEETQHDAPAPPHIQRGLAWLAANQNPETGAWPAWSLNKNRTPDNPVSLFMSDAATGYAVAALEEARRQPL
jgi:squalene-hopene/tetraprenyl-beta-curcumene cyclase